MICKSEKTSIIWAGKMWAICKVNIAFWAFTLVLTLLAMKLLTDGFQLQATPPRPALNSLVKSFQAKIRGIQESCVLLCG